MKLEETFLCLNCDDVFYEDHKQCPVCASTFIVPLAKFLAPMKYNRIIIRTFPIQGAKPEFRPPKLVSRLDAKQ